MAREKEYPGMTGERLEEFIKLYPDTPNKVLQERFGLTRYAVGTALPKQYGLKKKRDKIMKKVLKKNRKLSRRKEEWLVKHFADMSDADIAEALGTTQTLVRTVGRRNKLKKSEAYMKELRARMIVHAREHSNENPLWVEQQRERMRALRKAGVGHSFPKGHQVRDHYESEEAYRAMLTQRSAKRAETVRKEQLRLRWGLEQKTKLRLTRQRRCVCDYRSRFRRRGYMVEPYSMQVYYDDLTKRSEDMEKNAMALGFRIEEIKE